MEGGWCVSCSSELQDFFETTEIYDHQYVGSLYTWDNSHTFCKSDRVIVNDDWGLLMSDTTVEFLPKCISDHSPGVVRCFKAAHKCAPSFKFKNFWIQDPLCETPYFQ